MGAYYNENDAYAAQWLRNLIDKGLIAKGDVDDRSIIDVAPDDVRKFTQCHFFAGIGGWSHALRLAGWPDDRRVWTGSCPCQPFSVAGKGLGTDDPRHLWPHFYRLIAAARPPVVFGEQVSGAAGYGWLDGVRSDLAREDYACEAFDIPACAVDAPHIRSRLYWVASDVADADIADEGDGRVQRSGQQRGAGSDPQPRDSSQMADATHSGRREERADAGRSGAGDQTQGRAAGSDASRLDDADNARLEGHAGNEPCTPQGWSKPDRSVAAPSIRGDMADADHKRRDGFDTLLRTDAGGRDAKGFYETAGGRAANRTFWSDAIWLTGADGKARRAEPSISLLAHGIPARVGRLRAYGNAIVPQLAAEVIGAFLDVRP